MPITNNKSFQIKLYTTNYNSDQKCVIYHFKSESLGRIQLRNMNSPKKIIIIFTFLQYRPDVDLNHCNLTQ